MPYSKIKTLTKADLYIRLYEKIGRSRKKSAELVNAVFDIISEKLCGGQEVKLSGFGNFLLRDKKARMGRDPKTGRNIMISARRVAVFHSSPVLKKYIAQTGRGK